jgi:cytochrome c biogenesis protein CcmG/thiol:disulfide interchange protein DsbE
MSRWILILAPLAILAALVALFATQLGRDTSLVPSVLIDRPVPEFALQPVEELDSPGFGTAALTDPGEARVRVVNVFASWCVPCRDEHPLLEQLSERDDILLFGINQKDAPENARAFLAELGNPYDFVGADRDGRTSIEWGVYGVPETFVVSPSGIITYKHIGPISSESLAESVIPAIEAAKGR